MSLPNFKNCPNGHYYSASQSSCPYCAGGNGEATAKVNTGGGGQSGDGERTIVTGGSGPKGNNFNLGKDEPTRRETGAGFGGNSGMGGVDNSDRTTIVTGKTQGNAQAPGQTGTTGGHPADAPSEPRSTRKLTGWLVSYTIDPMGVDFRLFEGKNQVGRDMASTVRISSDGSVSSNHATILYRGEKFYIKDEMAVNPSFINGVELPPGATQEMKDGDLLRFGRTEFIFRKALI